MADFTAGPQRVNAGTPTTATAGTYVNVAAAAISVALIGGVGVWGYKLLVRDVTGVPVVRALEGEMRIAPENPGGEIAAHVGLSVNAVPGEGGAAEPEDRLVLAPSGVDMYAEDMEIAQPETMAEAGEVVPVDRLAGGNTVPEAVSATLETGNAEMEGVAAVDPTVPLSDTDVLALADQIAAGLSPMADLAAGADVPVEIAVNGVAINADIVPDAVPGVRMSIRPTQRPAAGIVPASLQQDDVASVPTSDQVSTAVIPAGTKLVQLGAFDSADIAVREWGQFTSRFPDFFADKEQVVQQATSGGRTFFRLRAMGFEDLNDARRFCSALNAEGSDCIPVVVR